MPRLIILFRKSSRPYSKIPARTSRCPDDFFQRIAAGRLDRVCWFFSRVLPAALVYFTKSLGGQVWFAVGKAGSAAAVILRICADAVFYAALVAGFAVVDDFRAVWPTSCARRQAEL